MIAYAYNEHLSAGGGLVFHALRYKELIEPNNAHLAHKLMILSRNGAPPITIFRLEAPKLIEALKFILADYAEETK